MIRKIRRERQRRIEREKRGWQRRVARMVLPSVTAVGLLLGGINYSLANPANGTVTSGSGNISANGSTTTITQSSDKLTLNWQSFNIGSGETVQFIQPGSNSIALNRVLGNDPSAIYGTLTANGKVFLLNPNGILFSPTAQVNVGGLVASTLNLTDADFLSDNYQFSGDSSAAVVNQGTLTSIDGGYIALLGPNVSNEGVITAREGTVALGAGSRITLDFSGDGLLDLAVDQAALNALVENKQLARLQADGGRVIMTAKAADVLAGSVVNNSGLMQAQSITNVNGEIILDGGTKGTVSVAGTLDASGKAAGQNGGTVKILGNKITTANVKIDASGDRGGGTINIGGDRRGQGPDQNAANTTIDRNSVIKADAIVSGNGGDITVWADATTNCAGTITARGGAQGGNGGLVETSGHTLDITGTSVSTAAPKGSGGTWLLDPYDLTVDASAAAAIATALNGGSNVDLQTTADNATTTYGGITNSSGHGDISINAAIGWSADTALTLDAYRNIKINANITASGGNAGLNLIYGSNGSLLTGVGAEVTLATGATLTLNHQTYNLIHDVTGLQGLNLNGYNALAANIDISALSAPLGSGGSLNGTLEGLGHTLSNLTINNSSADNRGLFAQIAGTGMVRNLRLANANVTGKDYTGMLTGHNYGTIMNISASGTVYGHYYVGGLTGWNSGMVANSYSTSAVTGGSPTDALDSVYVGGLVGSNVGTVTDSYNTGKVIGCDKAGGLVGLNDSGGTVKNSYSTGTVRGPIQVGTVFGNAVGGLVGWNLGTVTNSYSTGAVNGRFNVGGLVGWNYQSGTVMNSYWDIDTSGQSGGFGQNNATVQNTIGLYSNPVSLAADSTRKSAFDVSSYSWFDADGASPVWYLVDGSTRPFLRSEYSTTIVNAHQLQLMALDLTANYTLAADLSMTELANNTDLWNINTGFVPIGTNSTTAFTGSFDGRGHTISDLAIKRSSGNYVGLFGYTGSSAVIGNIGLNGGAVNGNDYVGSLVGWNSGTVKSSYSTGMLSGHNTVGGLVGNNDGGTVADSYSTGTTNGNGYVGGLVGNNDGGTVAGSHSTGATGGVSYVGGLVGYSDEGAITNSYSQGTINGISNIGGLVGYNYFSTVTNSYSTGAVSGNDNIGGLAGYNRGTVTGSWSTGAVNGHNEVGGIAGMNLGTVADSYSMSTVGGDNEVGGLVGMNIGTVRNSYSTGAISGSGNVGALVGCNLTGTIASSYWNQETSGQAVGIGSGTDTGGAIGLTTAAMKQASAYSNWGIADIGGTNAVWRIYDGYSYPLLKSFLQTLTVSADSVTKPYDGAAYSGSITGVTYTNANGSGDTAPSLVNGALSYGTDKNVGIYTLKDLYCTDQSGYDIIYSPNSKLTVNPREITVSAVADTKTYDGTTKSGLTPTASWLATGDTLSGVQEYDDKNAGTGKKLTVTNYDIDDGNGGHNYKVTAVYNDTTGTINKAALTISTGNVTKTYDGSTTASGSAVATNNTQLYGTDTLSGGSFVFTDKNAGAGNKTVAVRGVTVNDGNGGNNYDVNYIANTTSTINKAALTISTGNVTKIYNGTTEASGNAVVTGGTLLYGTDTISGGSFVFADKNAGTGNKRVIVSGVTVNDGNGGHNYDVNYIANTTSTINKAALTIGTGNVTKTYDGTTAADGNAVATGGTQLYGTDTLNGGSFAFSDKNAGTGNKKVIVSGVTVNDGNGGNNYDVNYSDNTTSTINKAALKISTGNVTKTYDGTTAASGSAVATGGMRLYGNDTLNGGSFIFADQNAGTGNKTVIVSGVTVNDGNGGSNYDVSYSANTTSTINKAMLTVTANNNTKLAGLPNPSFDATYVGFVTGETPDSLSGTLGFSTTATVFSPVGHYTITPSGVSSTNYNIIFADGVLTVQASDPINSSIAETYHMLDWGNFAPQNYGAITGPWVHIIGGGVNIGVPDSNVEWEE